MRTSQNDEMFFFFFFFSKFLLIFYALSVPFLSLHLRLSPVSATSVGLPARYCIRLRTFQQAKYSISSTGWVKGEEKPVKFQPKSYSFSVPSRFHGQMERYIVHQMIGISNADSLICGKPGLLENWHYSPLLSQPTPWSRKNATVALKELSRNILFLHFLYFNVNFALGAISWTDSDVNPDFFWKSTSFS